MVEYRKGQRNICTKFDAKTLSEGSSSDWVAGWYFVAVLLGFPQVGMSRSSFLLLLRMLYLTLTRTPFRYIDSLPAMVPLIQVARGIAHAPCIQSIETSTILCSMCIYKVLFYSRVEISLLPPLVGSTTIYPLSHPPSETSPNFFPFVLARLSLAIFCVLYIYTIQESIQSIYSTVPTSIISQLLLVRLYTSAK